jgi:hypothetical protein
VTAISKARAKPASTSRTNAKVEHPDKEFSNPTDVVVDPSLSTHDKLDALNSLEQDARQLAVATEEGMTGGEESQLRPVLQAKRSLEPPSPEAAFTVVLRELDQTLRQAQGTDAYAVISRAIDAIHEAREAIANLANAPKVPPGAPKPGSREELQEEIDKEKLDPGG